MKKQTIPKAIADINVTPMVDVMLVMLIIFMVITPMLSKGIPLDLTKVNNPIAMADADKDDAVVVSVTKDGKVYLGPDKSSVEAIPEKVKDMLKDRIDKTCYVRGDSRARYEIVVNVVDALRSSGVDQIGLLTESTKTEELKPEGGA